MKTYKALAILLSYPNPIWIDEVAGIIDAIEDEKMLSMKSIKQLRQFGEQLNQGDILDIQEVYSNLFDKGLAHCLNLFEHIYGESRDRGQAMVELQENYLKAGLERSSDELPDYLPMYLEYLAQLGAEDAKSGLNDIIEIVAIIAERLRSNTSNYVVIFDALVELSTKKLSTKEIKQAAEKVKAEQSLEEIDASWEEVNAFDNSGLCTNGTGNNNQSNNGVRVAIPVQHSSSGRTYQ